MVCRNQQERIKHQKLKILFDAWAPPTLILISENSITLFFSLLSESGSGISKSSAQQNIQIIRDNYKLYQRIIYGK